MHGFCKHAHLIIMPVYYTVTVFTHCITINNEHSSTYKHRRTRVYILNNSYMYVQTYSTNTNIKL